MSLVDKEKSIFMQVKLEKDNNYMFYIGQHTYVV